MAATKLALSTIDLPPYAALGLTQSWEPIGGQGNVRRTINGDLVDLSDPAFYKFHSSVQCKHFQSPSFNDVHVGQLVTVNCVFELSYLIPTPEDEDPVGEGAMYPIVAGSIRDRDGFRFYRPAIPMMVIGFAIDRDEFGAQTGWSLELEEV